MSRRHDREGVSWHRGGPCDNGEVDRLVGRMIHSESRADRIACEITVGKMRYNDPHFVLRVTHLGVLASINRTTAPRLT